MQLYLIRHGESHVNLADWNNGNIDEGLTDLGREQATALAAWLPTYQPAIDALYASTMRRAYQTAEFVAAAYGSPIRGDDRLREIGNNRADHTPWPNDDLPRDYAEYWASERPFASITPQVAGGETWMHFRTRVGLFIEEIVTQHPDQRVIAVCHGGVIEAVFDHVFNVGPWHRTEVWVHNTGITHLEYLAQTSHDTWRLHYHNRTSHLNR